MPLIHWNPDPILFRLSFAQVHWYGLFFASSFLIGNIIFGYFLKKEGKNRKLLDPFLLTMIVSIVIGARLGHCFFYDFGYYIQNPIEILQVWKGGLASHGAAIGILVGVWLFGKRHPETPFLWTMDRLMIITSLAAALIRIGNLMNSEIIGKATDGTWGFIFDKIDQTPRHPTQLYESFYYLGVFLLLWILYHKTTVTKFSGRIFGLYFALTFGFRFLIEFLKENQSNIENSMALNMGQSLSLPLILIGLFFIYNSNRLHKSQQ